MIINEKGACGMYCWRSIRLIIGIGTSDLKAINQLRVH